MIVRHDGEPDTSSDPSVVAIGVFDGLHRGHQAVLVQLVELARAYHALATVVTFDPSPASVLAPDRAPHLLETIEQRLEGFEQLGIDQVRVLTFSKALASESAAEFIDGMLVKELHARCVVVGEDFHFGHNREGTLATLRAAGAERGFDVVAAPTHGDDERWSSTSVRRALADGDLDRAAAHPRTPLHPARDRHPRRRARGRAGLSDGQPATRPGTRPSRSEGVYAGAVELDGAWRAGGDLGRAPSAVLPRRGAPRRSAPSRLRRHSLRPGARRRLSRPCCATRRPSPARRSSSEQIGRDVAQTQQIFAEFSKNAAKLLR